MLSVALKLIVLKPQLLLTHIQNYSNLVLAEGSKALMTWRIQMILYVVSALMFGLGAFSLVTSVLLWAALPILSQMTSWILVALPALILLGSASLFMFAKTYRNNQFVDIIHEQIQLDKELLCKMLERNH
jgi:hypothetical protein